MNSFHFSFFFFLIFIIEISIVLLLIFFDSYVTIIINFNEKPNMKSLEEIHSVFKECEELLRLSVEIG